MTERLYLRCPNGHEFRSPIQIDRASFETATVHGNSTSCPTCAVPVLIDKETTYFKDE